MRYSIVLGVGLGTLLLLGGCDQAEDILSEADLREALKALVALDEVFSTTGLDDGALYDDDYDQDLSLGKVRADTLWPGRFGGIRWGRQIHEHAWDLSFDEIGGDTAYATITGTLSGILFVGGWNYGLDSLIVIQDTISKPFELVTKRRVCFARVANTGDPLEDWRIDGLTALIGTVGSKVSLEDISVSLSDTGATYFSLPRDEVLLKFFDRQNLPTFKPLRPVAVYITIANAGPELPIWSGERVVIRHGRSQGMYSRRGLNDLGMGIDAAANDDVYSGIWYPHQRPMLLRTFRLFVEVTDLATLLVEEEPFHMEFIGLPYLVDTIQQRRPF